MIKLEVGKEYETRDGHRFKVEFDDGDDPLPCSDGYWRTRDGRVPILLGYADDEQAIKEVTDAVV